MELLELFIIGLFFVVLFMAFRNEFVNQNEDYFTSNLTTNNFYPLNPSDYRGYWGFRPYKGLWRHINPWWYYPYPYPLPIGFNDCNLKSSNLQ